MRRLLTLLFVIGMMAAASVQAQPGMHPISRSPLSHGDSIWIADSIARVAESRIQVDADTNTAAVSENATGSGSGRNLSLGSHVFNVFNGREGVVINDGQVGYRGVAINGGRISGTGSVAIGAGHGLGFGYNYGTTGSQMGAAGGTIAIGSGDVGDRVREGLPSDVDADADRISLSVSVGFNASLYRAGASGFGNSHAAGNLYTFGFGNGTYATQPGAIVFGNMIYKDQYDGKYWDRFQEDGWMYLWGDVDAAGADTISALGTDGDGGGNPRIEGWHPDYMGWQGETVMVTAHVRATSTKSRKVYVAKFEFVIRSVDNTVTPDSVQILGLEKKVLYSNSDMDVVPTLRSYYAPWLLWIATGDSAEATRWAIKYEYKSIYW